VILTEKKLENKKIALIIAFREFRDEEYFISKEILERSGVKISTVSDLPGKAIGKEGGETEVDLLLEKLNPAEFDVVVFIGGPGALKHLDNQVSYNIAKETVLKEKILAAICISPVILAKSGVLKNKTATVWTGTLDKTALKFFKENGAIYQEGAVVIDEKIITGRDSDAVQEFAEAVISVLTN
jgi:protease I